MSMALVDRALMSRERAEDVTPPVEDGEFVLSQSDNVDPRLTDQVLDPSPAPLEPAAPLLGVAAMRDPLLIVEGLSKDFTLHQQGGVQLPVLRGVSLTLRAGECIALTGPSGAGKSTPVQALFDNDLSGGEQQGINLARGFALPYTVMLVDEPTASLVRPIPKSRSR